MSKLKGTAEELTSEVEELKRVVFSCRSTSADNSQSGCELSQSSISSISLPDLSSAKALTTHPTKHILSSLPSLTSTTTSLSPSTSNSLPNPPSAVHSLPTISHTHSLSNSLPKKPPSGNDPPHRIKCTPAVPSAITNASLAHPNSFNHHFLFEGCPAQKPPLSSPKITSIFLPNIHPIPNTHPVQNVPYLKLHHITLCPQLSPPHKI